MSDETNISDVIVRTNDAAAPEPTVLSASTLAGNDVYNLKDEKLGSIKEFMLDIPGGNVRYAVLSYGGFLGMGEKLFAVPWSALTLDKQKRRFLLDAEVDRLADAPGFDTDHWPNMADAEWAIGIHTYYGTQSDAARMNVPHI